MEKKSNRAKKQDEKLATKQKILLDSQQAMFFDLEAESILSIPPIPSQVTNKQGMTENEGLKNS